MKCLPVRIVRHANRELLCMVSQIFTFIDEQQIVSVSYISCILCQHSSLGLDLMLDTAITITCLPEVAYEPSVYLST